MTLNLKIDHISFATLLSERLVLICGRLDIETIKNATLFAAKIKLGRFIAARWTENDILMTAMLVELPDPAHKKFLSLSDIEISSNTSAVVWSCADGYNFADFNLKLLPFLDSLSGPLRKNLLHFLLYHALSIQPDLKDSPEFTKKIGALFRGVKKISSPFTSAIVIQINLMMLSGEIKTPANKQDFAQGWKLLVLHENYIQENHLVLIKNKLPEFTFLAPVTENNAQQLIVTDTDIYLLPNRTTKGNIQLTSKEMIEVVRRLNAKDTDKLIVEIFKTTYSEQQAEKHAALLTHLQLAKPLPLPVKIIAEGVATKIDHIIVTRKGAAVVGSYKDPHHLIDSIELHSALGHSLAFKNAAIEYSDKKERSLKHFMHYAPWQNEITNNANIPLIRFKINLLLKDGSTFSAHASVNELDPFLLRSNLLAIPPSSEINRKSFLTFFYPVISDLQETCQYYKTIKTIRSFVGLHENPDVSIIIPLYKNLEYISLQIAAFSADPFISKQEIIYVCDSPEQEQELYDLLDLRAQLYALPIKLIIHSRNFGYATAVHSGVTYSRGKKLLFMNSDCVPASLGWLSKMSEFYSTTPGIGALGVRLLFEDDTIQHGGIYFRQSLEGLYLGAHTYEGMPSMHKEALKNQKVLAVTGACLMISKTIYQDIGGISKDTVIGDFEDIDLCLKCTQKGYHNWYLGDVALYHFERQSMAQHEGYFNNVWRYNALLHAKKWNDIINKMLVKK